MEGTLPYDMIFIQFTRQHLILKTPIAKINFKKKISFITNYEIHVQNELIYYTIAQPWVCLRTFITIDIIVQLVQTLSSFLKLVTLIHCITNICYISKETLHIAMSMPDYHSTRTLHDIESRGYISSVQVYQKMWLIFKPYKVEHYKL